MAPAVSNLNAPNGAGDGEMAGEFEALHTQNMAGMGQAITRFQGDAVTVSKAADYSYLQDKGMVSLPEALGAREVGSKETPAGPGPVGSAPG